MTQEDQIAPEPSSDGDVVDTSTTKEPAPDPSLAEGSAPAPKGKFHTIMAPVRLQVDTTIATLLLQEYGEPAFEGVSSAGITYVKELPDGKTAMQLEKDGIIVIDMGGGRFDHHRKTRAEEQECVSLILAKYLGIDTDPALNKILTFAQRDDVEGRGIISKDRIDRAFGFSGLFNNIMRDHPKRPERVFAIVKPVLLAHIHEERTRNHVLPKEYMTRFDSGDVVAFVGHHKGRKLRAIAIDSDRRGMIGFLRAHPSIKADIVAQRFSTGHINIVTNQRTQMDLTHVAGLVRTGEALAQGLDVSAIPFDRFNEKGVLNAIPQWYVDTAANTVQNGGVDPDGWPPTKLNLKEVQEMMELGLNPPALKKMSLSKSVQRTVELYKKSVQSFADATERKSGSGSSDGRRQRRRRTPSSSEKSFGDRPSTPNKAVGGGTSLEQLVQQQKKN